MGQRTPLYDLHLALGAKMVDFGGWDMPLHYGSQVEEHHQVRRDCGVFDVSHMTVIDVTGPEAKEWLLLSKGLFKKFNEEICSLSLFAAHFYKERSDVKCIPNLDNRDFDATIRDYSTAPPSELKVEITVAMDKIKGREENLRIC